METRSVSSGYVPGIDGLRAIAVSAVILYHMDVLSFPKGGFTGVDIFFVISGYVISKSLYNKSSLRFPAYLSEFYKRRILRIIPALIVCLLFTILASTLFIPSSWLSRTISKTGISAFLGYSNFALVWYNDGYFSPRVDYNPFLHTWSLAVEEQFYLLFPLIYYIWLKLRKNKSIAGYASNALLAVLGMASLIYACFATKANPDRAFYLLPARFWELAAGALLFKLHSNNGFLPKSKHFSSFLLSCGIAVIGAGFVLADQNAFPFPWALVPVTGTVLLTSGVVSAGDKPSRFQRFLSASIMTYIGKISYSLYLWHWPVSALLRWTIGFNTLSSALVYLVVMFVLAATSFHCIETPIRTSQYLRSRKNWQIILGGITVVLLAFFAARFIVNAKPKISLSVTKDEYIWYSRRYRADRPKQPITVDPNIAGRQLFAVGDSHTAAYRTMLQIVSGRLGFEVHEYEEGGCAVGGLLKPMSEIKEGSSFYEYALNDVKKLAKPGDILFLASLRMPELTDRVEQEVLAECNSLEAVKCRQLALEETSQLIEEFKALGVHVLIDAPKPILKAPPFRCSDWFNRMNPICAPGLTIERDFLLQLRQPVMDSLRILQQRHQNLYIWDPLLVLCDKEVFSAFDDDGKPIFMDGDHLSAHGNRLLAPSFEEMVLTIWRSHSTDGGQAKGSRAGIVEK
ncbi:MAG: acyltransferase [Sedimentisphaerales bacterium]|nr:acyltransferase [Sedimentisphaerales bacterium]